MTTEISACELPALCENRFHGCQIHQRESSLVEAVVAFLAAGASNGENLVVITRPDRQKKVLEWLRAKVPDPRVLNRPGSLVVYSNHDFIDEILRDGLPSWDAYAPKANALFQAASDSGRRGVRCYADAVSELWRRGEHAAAVELEVLSNRLLQDHPTVNVFCGYLINALSPASYSEHLEMIGRLHGRVVGSRDERDLLGALDVATREITGEGLSVGAVSHSSTDWRNRLPRSMRHVFNLLEADRGTAERVLSRAREVYETGV